MRILVKIVAWSIVLCYFAKKYTRQAMINSDTTPEGLGFYTMNKCS